MRNRTLLIAAAASLLAVAAAGAQRPLPRPAIPSAFSAVLQSGKLRVPPPHRYTRAELIQRLAKLPSNPKMHAVSQAPVGGTAGSSGVAVPAVMSVTAMGVETSTFGAGVELLDAHVLPGESGVTTVMMSPSSSASLTLSGVDGWYMVSFDIVYPPMGSPSIAVTPLESKTPIATGTCIETGMFLVNCAVAFQSSAATGHAYVVTLSGAGGPWIFGQATAMQLY